MSMSYEPERIKEYGKDRMRFELGDTLVEGGADTTALSDEEIMAILETEKNWKKAKLFLLESICRRFSYEVDTKAGSLSLSLGERAKLWREDYEKLKKELNNTTFKMTTTSKTQKPPYFYTGMMDNNEVN